jgi:hypothetical protein
MSQHIGTTAAVTQLQRLTHVVIICGSNPFNRLDHAGRFHFLLDLGINHDRHRRS